MYYFLKDFLNIRDKKRCFGESNLSWNGKIGAGALPSSVIHDFRQPIEESEGISYTIMCSYVKH